MVKPSIMEEQQGSSIIPSSGRWVWKDDTNTLEFVGNPTGGDRHVGKRDRRQNKAGVHFPGEHSNKAPQDRHNAPSSRFAKDRRSGGRQANPNKGKEVVTLHNVKLVAYDMMAEVEEISPYFDQLFVRFQFDDFLSCLFNYFHYFFEKKQHEEKPNPMNIEPSAKEKRQYGELCANVEGAQKLLGSAYCVLVMGIGLGVNHHMACGQSRVSNTYQDRASYETLYTYCTFAVWIAFKRKDFDSVKKEISRILRSDTFNPALRVKNAPESDEEEKEDKKKLTPAEYRRVQGKRPPIKSIINQRSPALVSILPSSKEDASYLFTSRGLSPSFLADLDKEDENEDEENLKQLHNLSQYHLKLGIIGEPLSQYNKVTLTPLGAEHGEEQEDPDGEKDRRQSTMTSSQMKQNKEGAVSREATGVSAITVEALPDED